MKDSDFEENADEVKIYLTHQNCQSFAYFKRKFKQDDYLIFNINLANKFCYFIDQFSKLHLTVSIFLMYIELFAQKEL